MHLDFLLINRLKQWKLELRMKSIQNSSHTQINDFE